MPRNITLIAPNGERFSEPVDNGCFSLPWLHPYEDMNGVWTVLETGYSFNIELPYIQEWEANIVDITEVA